jgi:hypothetical protein
MVRRTRRKKKITEPRWAGSTTGNLTTRAKLSLHMFPFREDQREEEDEEEQKKK